MKKKIYYEVEEFADGSLQIACGDEAKKNFLGEIKHGAKLLRFVEAKK